MAPRPAPADPSAPSPVSLGEPAAVVPTPEFAPVGSDPVDAGAVDRGGGDSYEPPMPPLPDGGIPADGRMEPRQQD
jgi:hypothetical protein